MTLAPGPLVAFTVAVTRAVAVLAMLGALSAAYLLALDEHGGPASHPNAATGEQVWKEAYSRRFPGCVAVVLWPPREVPRALVVRDRRGTLTELSLREVVVLSRESAFGQTLRTVGMCR